MFVENTKKFVELNKGVHLFFIILDSFFLCAYANYVICHENSFYLLLFFFRSSVLKNIVYIFGSILEKQQYF